ncbi:hypothetical protein FOCG_04308 [Fusarium oxysporum f. sp. radicis-lycopersici 26381]|nr:hypothetical protein FOCG_04308 [Fusarium oxysporum f. sp. radicis-lycopersici 26381]
MRRRARLEVETNSSHWQPVFAHHQPQMRVFELQLSLPGTSHHTLDIENRIGLCGPAQLDLTPWQARETRSLEHRLLQRRLARWSDVDRSVGLQYSKRLVHPKATITECGWPLHWEHTW